MSDNQGPFQGNQPPENTGFTPQRPPMGGPGGPGGGPPMRRGPGGRPRGKYAPRRKVCQFCVDKVSHIDYKDLMRLRRFLSERAKIEPRRKTGTCAKHQRRLAIAMKRARQIALLPFTAEHLRTMGGIVQPVPGQPLPPERPWPPRDSFGPGGSQPGGQRQEGAPRQDGPPRQEGPPRVEAPVAEAPAAEAPATEAAPAAEAPAAEAAPTESASSASAS